VVLLNRAWSCPLPDSGARPSSRASSGGVQGAFAARAAHPRGRLGSGGRPASEAAAAQAKFDSGHARARRRRCSAGGADGCAASGKRYGSGREGRGRAVASASRATGVPFLLVAEDRGARPAAWPGCSPTGIAAAVPYLKLAGGRCGACRAGVGHALLRAASTPRRRIRPELFILCAGFNGGRAAVLRARGLRRAGGDPGYVLPDVDEVIFFRRWQA